MGARCCNSCEVNWPIGITGSCPQCGSPIAWSPSAQPIDKLEVARRMSYVLFEQFLAGETIDERAERRARWRTGGEAAFLSERVKHR